MVMEVCTKPGTTRSPAVHGLPAHCAAEVGAGRLLLDPLELRPLPLSGIPGWHPDNAGEAFHRGAACYQPRRAGREYPPASPIP